MISRRTALAAGALMSICLAKVVFAVDPWRTDSFQLTPKAGGAPYVIQLATPAGQAPAAGYPVIYVLDAAQSFGIASDILHLQELFFGPVVLVGVRYDDPFEVDRRGFDLTPTPDPSWAARSPPGDSGGADAFLAFLQNELKPEIAKRVRIDSAHQALFGHSLGGLFALHVLFTRPGAFDTYVAASPSLQYGGHQILKRLPDLLEKGIAGTSRRVLITKGELEKGPTPEELRFAKQQGIPVPPPSPAGQDSVSRLREFVKNLQAVKGVEVSFVEFPGETHNSSIPAYLGRGMRWTLMGWSPP
jgi:predicted alpha/beta superfamily hydrolase